MHYINFMCDRDNAVANALYTYYASPLTNVVEDAEYQASMAEVHEDAMDILYGDREALEQAQPYLNLSPERLVMLNGLWEELKGASSIGPGIYAGCIVIVAALIVIVGYQVIKKRRWAKLYD